MRPGDQKARRNSAPNGVMLAQTWKGEDPTGWWMSEKLDGMRAYWTGDEFYTRNGNVVAAPKWFKAAMPPIALDGELTMGRTLFQDTISVVRKATPRDPRWKNIKYIVFDAPEMEGPFEARMNFLRDVVEKARRRYRWERTRGSNTPTHSPLVMVDQIKIRSRDHLKKYHDKVVRLGGEGVMIRRPQSNYLRKRSWDLQKVKNFLDTEAVITGYAEGKGKYEGMLGAYRARLLKGTKKAFQVGSGITDLDRAKPLPKGTIITIRFFEYTRDGVPRFPTLVGARDYE